MRSASEHADLRTGGNRETDRWKLQLLCNNAVSFYIYSSHLKSDVAEEQAVAAEQVTSASAGWLAHRFGAFERGRRILTIELSTAARSPWATVTICAIAG